jgi:DNA polymerase III subunit beta
MKFKVSREELLKAIHIASKAITMKTPIPVLSNFKMTIDDKGLTLISSNNELSIVTRIPYTDKGRVLVSDSKPGGTLVNAKLFAEIARKVEGNELTVELFDDTIVNVSDGKSSYKLNSIKVEEYPELDLDTTGVTLDLEAKILKKVVEQTAFAASTKEQRPIMTAVNLEASDGKLIATATDSARLSRKQINIQKPVKFSSNVPARTLIEVVSMIEGDQMVNLSFTEKRATFEFGHTLVISRLVGGEYPNTANIIPKTSNYYLVANAKELLSAMERVALLSLERENVVKLTMSETAVEVSSKSAQIGSASEPLTKFSFNGDGFEVSFNAFYLMEAIRAFGAEDIRIGFIGDMRPFVLKNDKDDSLIQLATPVRTY